MDQVYGCTPPAAGGSQTIVTTSRRTIRARFYFALLLLDLAAITAGMFLASCIYFGPLANWDWMWMTGALIPLYLGGAFAGRAYAVALVQGGGVLAAVQALVVAIGLLLMIAFLLQVGPQFSRATLILGSAVCALNLSILRGWFLRRSRRLLGGSAYSVTIIQDGVTAPQVQGASMVVSADGLVDPHDQSPATFERLAALLAGADRVIVACPESRRLAWSEVLKGSNIRGEVLAPEIAAIAPLGTSNWASQPTLVVSVGPLGTADSFLKRTFDIAISLTALVILSPLLVATALAIKLDSRGPVLFVQPRLGQGNRVFRMLKFRSMRAEAVDRNGVQSASRNDDRVTRVGAFIRRTSIDELPQLLNVLRGDMSIVGPRPHALGSRAADKLFWEIDSRYWHRHAAKPGLTGLAQIRGFRGATVHETDLTDRLQADLEYLQGWTVWRDLAIIALTFRVLVHRNAF